MKLARRVAQAAFGAPFIWMGYKAASEPGGRIAAAEKLGVPSPEIAVRFNGAAMMAGGAALCANVLPRAAATGMIASLIPTTLAGHAFWTMDAEDPARAMQFSHALKNLMLTAALAQIALRD